MLSRRGKDTNKRRQGKNLTPTDTTAKNATEARRIVRTAKSRKDDETDPESPKDEETSVGQRP